jgi:hypothetical protein
VATTDTDTAALIAEMRQLRADFARVCDTVQGMAQQRGGEMLGGAQDAAAKLWDEARKHTNGLAREIEAKPVPAALGAFVLGMLLGALFSARRR